MESFVSIPACEVARACLRYLKARTKAISDQREALIVEAMKPQGGFLATLLGRVKVRTREEAIEFLKEPGADIVSRWELPALSGGLWASRVEELLVTAQTQPTRHIQVVSSLVSLLDNHWGDGR